MSYSQDIESCLARKIGAQGLSEAAYAAMLERSAGALARLRRRHDEGSLALLRLPAARDDLVPLRAIAEELRERFDHLVVLGTGGSSLGGQALAALTADPFAPRRPRLWFIDNIDPHGFSQLLDGLDPPRTAFLVISKSGTTAETVTQFLIAFAAMREALGEADLAAHFIIVTEPGERPLRRLARRWSLPVLDHDPDLGGRFSVLSLVGVLPALVAGVDAEALRAGAAEVLDATLGASAPADSLPAVGAAVAIGLLRERAVTASVMMPYCDRLAPFGLWYRQLWAESLGKKGTGTTPIRALGVVDQHSQLQLYLDGPRDKMYSLIGLDEAETERLTVPVPDGEAALDYLRGRTMDELFAAERRATAEALARNGRPVRVIHLTELTASSLGALMMHFMLETIIAADLLGVNAFDQPAVEQGKVLARSYLAGRAAGEAIS